MRARRTAVLALLVGFALAVAVAALSLYAERTLFDSGRFADRVEVALANEDVAADVADSLSTQLVRADANLIAVEPLLRGVAEQVVRSRPFRSLAGRAAFEAHAAVFREDRDTAVFVVGNSALLVTQALEAVDPKVAREIPPGVRTTFASFSDGPIARAFVDLAQVAERVRALGLIAVVLALLLLAGALALTPRGARVVTVVRAGWALGIVGALLVFGVEIGGLVVGGLGDTDQRALALRAVWGVFLGDLAVWGFALAAAGLVLVAAATSRATEPTLALRALALAGRVAARPQRPALGLLRAAALIVLGVLIATEPLGALRLLAIAAGLFVVALGVDELMALAHRQRVGAGASAGAPGGGRRVAAGAGTGGPGARPAIAGVRPYAVLIAVALLGMVAIGAIGVSAATQDRLPELGCNGSDALCDRRLDEVAIPGTHNSMAAARDGFLLANQESGIRAQLDGGIRGLLIDMHVGVRTPRGVYTVLEAGGKSRGKLYDAIGPQATSTALRLRRQIGFRASDEGTPKVFLCHGFCEIGAIEAERALRDVRDFLVANPGAVLAISIEDQVTPEQVEDVFERSGLIDYVWKGSIRPLPTLGEMVERDERVVVFGEEETAGVGWYHDQFTYVRETPYDIPTAELLLSPEGCRFGRGRPDNPLLMMNQFVAGDPPLPRAAQQLNSVAAIVGHARQCRVPLHGLPGLIAVDFWEKGDVVGAARRLNGIDAGA